MNPDLETLRFDLCCAARILYRAGLSVANAGHISIAIGENRMLVNRFGPSFATLCPADILTVNFDGHVIDHHPAVDPYVNETIQLHGVIHRYNPQIAAVVHTHPPGTVTWSAFRKAPEIFDQESCILAGDVAIVEEDYTGIAASEERVRPFALALGKSAAVILPNHGALTSGSSVQLAVARMILLEGMCQRNLAVYAAAKATGFTPHPIALENAMNAKRELARIPFLQPLWNDFLQRLQQSDPALFAPRAAAAD
jgi:ribulose-5-phosphate 4-epimerase/fuculose-1-phosphate aldolase